MLKKIKYIFCIFFYLNTFVFASEFIVGESYSGTLKNLYNQYYNITLPPGTWDVDQIDVDGKWQNIKLFN